MRNLWAPWRMEYILGERENYCIFCPPPPEADDAERLILFRGRYCMVVMNRYPYNNGHLLVAPWRHLPSLEGLTDEELLELNKLVRSCIRIIKKVMHPDGFNVGLNLGKVAGAGMADHLHYHVVPRWNGDTSFITVLGEVRTIPEHLQQTYRKLKPYFEEGEFNEAL